MHPPPRLGVARNAMIVYLDVKLSQLESALSPRLYKAPSGHCQAGSAHPRQSALQSRHRRAGPHAQRGQRDLHWPQVQLTADARRPPAAVLYDPFDAFGEAWHAYRPPWGGPKAPPVCRQFIGGCLKIFRLIEKAKIFSGAPVELLLTRHHKVVSTSGP